MISKKVLQKVKELEIHTKKALRGSHIGGFQSKQKGFGFEFDQLRSYQYGDDVRLIDWKSSARSSDLLVRQYFEERNRTFFICLDVSNSTTLGSDDLTKQEMMQQVAGVLSLAAEYGNDKVGLILFSDTVEELIIPAKGKNHIHSIIEKIFTHKPLSKKTDVNVLCEYVAHKIEKHAVVFIISDFIASDFEKTLKKASVNKEIIAVCCIDKNEKKLPSVGLLWTKDLETDQKVLVDTSRQVALDQVLQNRLKTQKKIFQKYRVDSLYIDLRKNFIHDLVTFFQKRLIY